MPAVGCCFWGTVLYRPPATFGGIKKACRMSDRLYLRVARDTYADQARVSPRRHFRLCPRIVYRLDHTIRIVCLKSEKARGNPKNFPDFCQAGVGAVVVCSVMACPLSRVHRVQGVADHGHGRPVVQPKPARACRRRDEWPRSQDVLDAVQGLAQFAGDYAGGPKRWSLLICSHVALPF